MSSTSASDDTGEPLSEQELAAAHCWERDDRVPGRPEMTAFRRRVRFEQARWRESTWLEHLLMLSMLQHPSRTWSWGRYVRAHPAGNCDYADVCTCYRALLADHATFSSLTLEDLLDSRALPAPTVAALRDRYGDSS